MAYAPARDLHHGTGPRIILGEFREKEHGQTFEYSRMHEGELAPWPEYPTKVWVTHTRIGGEQGFRWAKVLETVVYLCTDENADGSPVVEKWHIKGHRHFA